MTMNNAFLAEMPDEDLVPEWDLADRMTKSLRVRGISVGAMAESFGLSRETIGRWLSGRAEPDKGRLFFWATLTGVNLEWLETGERACRDSNPKPSVLELVHSAEPESVNQGLTANRPTPVRRIRALRSVS